MGERLYFWGRDTVFWQGRKVRDNQEVHYDFKFQISNFKLKDRRKFVIYLALAVLRLAMKIAISSLASLIRPSSKLELRIPFSARISIQ